MEAVHDNVSQTMNDADNVSCSSKPTPDVPFSDHRGLVFNQSFESTSIFKQLSHIGKSIPIVSVGSGTGCAERVIQNKFKDYRIICVDPEPTSYEPYPKNTDLCMKPHYANVEALIAHEPNIVGDCILVLIWPNPSDYMDTALPYDILSLFQLQPRATYIYYDYTGGSGSGAMIRWIDTRFPELNLNFKSHMWVAEHEPGTAAILPKLPNYKHVWVAYSAEETSEGFLANRTTALWMEHV